MTEPLASRAVVIDASAIGTAHEAVIRAESIHAPDLIDVEIASLLRKAVIRHHRSPASAEAQLAAWLDNAVVRHAHRPLIRDVWALRDAITPYDATYVVLARGLGVPLVTRDRRLARAAAPFCTTIAVD